MQCWLVIGSVELRVLNDNQTELLDRVGWARVISVVSHRSVLGLRLSDGQEVTAWNISDARSWYVAALTIHGCRLF